jgi:NADH:ubiquinone reductase (H+-translocating)
MRSLPHVVIIGAGFGGLTLAKALASAPVSITVIDRRNHHLFQPLLYQVAIAGLGSNDIAAPIRSVLAHQENTEVLLAEARAVDVAHRRVELDSGSIHYDYLVIATGARTSYFGHDDWEKLAPGLKTIDDALEIRRRVLLAFERAERAAHDGRRQEAIDLLTFVVIGAGPTGVELAGAIAELSRTVARVLLVEAGPKVLASMHDPSPERAAAQLAELGVDVRTRCRMVAIDEHSVSLQSDGAEPERIATSTVVWAAGVTASALVQTLGTKLDRQGRVEVEPDLSIADHPEVFVIGDTASFLHDRSSPGKPLPGLSPVAMQQARVVARNIRRTLEGIPRERFHYFDKGSMATIGRSRAVAELGRLRMSGLLAWIAWLFVHIFYLIDFRNRLAVMMEWAWSYLTFRRGARIIVEEKRAPDAKP